MMTRSAWRRSSRGKMWRHQSGPPPKWRTARDEGQALIIVLVIVSLLALVAPVLVAQISNEENTASQSELGQDALAAAEAGVQWYTTQLDVLPNYWRYDGGSNPYNDPALAVGGWRTVAGGPAGGVAEAFHYIPDTDALDDSASKTANEVILTVTGRAGSAGDYVTKTIQADLKNNGILSDAYFSQEEVVDPAQNSAIVCVTPPKDSTSGCSATAGGTTATTPSYIDKLGVTDISLNVSVPTATGPTTEDLWDALCNYETYQPNLFVDSLDKPNPYVGGDYSAKYPYYGPYRGLQPDLNKAGYSGALFTYTYPSSSPEGTVSIYDPCDSPFDWVAGENFTGPVYTNDQLFVCTAGGDSSEPLDFEDGLTSGIPAKDPFTYSQWPMNGLSDSGKNGWINNGTVDWDNSCSGSPYPPVFGRPGLQDGGTEKLPLLDTYLESEAGCVYSGPTIIEFDANQTYNVWSPLSGNLGPCGSFSASAPFVSGLTIPTAGLVIYVQAASPSSVSDLVTTPQLQQLITEGALPPGATCLNPWKPFAPPTTNPTNGMQSACTEATEGDAIVGGEVRGEVTIGTANNIIISRDLTYECADGGGVAAQESTSFNFSAACTTKEEDPDVLGLVAQNDVIISKPGVEMTEADLEATDTGSGGSSTLDTFGGTDDQAPRQTEPYEWPAIETTEKGPNTAFCTQDGVSAQLTTVQEAVPDCEIGGLSPIGPVVDAAVVALGGSFTTEDWDMGADVETDSGGGIVDHGAGEAWLYGTDASFYRGTFGCEGTPPACAAIGPGSTTGYNKEFTYDQRLKFLTPPSMIAATDSTWSPASFVDCGDQDNESNPDSNLCVGLSRLDGG